jgi:metallo-beta-lactamase class B
LLRTLLARITLIAVVTAATLPTAGVAQKGDPLTAAYPESVCRSCAAWNQGQSPFRLFGNTYFVGTRGLSALLITSTEGHVLIDGGLPNSAPLIIAGIESLGFDIGDVKLILNSHAHFDHAGGIAALQRASSARVAASGPSAQVLERGSAGADDPQYGVAFDFPAVVAVERFDDGETLRVGPLSLTAHLTPGHTPGGTTWTWESCEASRCLSFVYADSQTPVSADDFRFSGSSRYPTAVEDFERGFGVLEELRCDILVTPHPGQSSLWDRVASGPDGLIDPDACRRYAASARQALSRRLQREAEGP